MTWSVNVDPQALDDLNWHKKKDPNSYKKCLKFLEEMKENPRYGTGQPERLKHFGEQEVWSRRVNKKDRMIYSIYETKTTNEVDVHYCRGHYD